MREDIKWIQDILMKKDSMSSELCMKQERDRNSVIEKRRGLHLEENDKKDTQNTSSSLDRQLPDV